MKLYHVSENSSINIFEPRLPSRKDLDPSVGLVWAIDEAHLPNFLTPRNCPRVTYHVRENTSLEDRSAFFSSPSQQHAVVIESAWYKTMATTTLYIYEFDPADFELQDEIAGYYVAKCTQKPIACHVISDLFDALLQKNVELRVVDSLWPLANKVKNSTLGWSLCRMKNARPQK